MAHSRPEKIRLDTLLVDRGLVESRAKAQGLILAGQILVDEQKQEKCGTLVDAQAALRLLGEAPKYVSRGGLKLEGALEHFRINPDTRVCLDVGASTGGFTDCLLQHGAGKVFAVDGGTNQLDWKLRQDSRVVALEKTNARYLTFDRIGTLTELVTIDVSFISATLILPALVSLLASPADLIVLVKPQFEVGKGRWEKVASCVTRRSTRRPSPKFPGNCLSSDSASWHRWKVRCWARKETASFSCMAFGRRSAGPAFRPCGSSRGAELHHPAGGVDFGLCR
jgi:23S rRNA (cytidine1920-2'-O)/16S rRNA (cytidine1409-2'-O)-methyltransferase